MFYLKYKTYLTNLIRLRKLYSLVKKTITSLNTLAIYQSYPPLLFLFIYYRETLLRQFEKMI